MLLSQGTVSNWTECHILTEETATAAEFVLSSKNGVRTNNRWLKIKRSESESWILYIITYNNFYPSRMKRKISGLDCILSGQHIHSCLHINTSSYGMLNFGSFGGFSNKVVINKCITNTRGLFIRCHQVEKSATSDKQETQHHLYKNNTTIQTTAATPPFLEPSNSRKIKPSLTLPTMTLVDHTTNP